jgi:hypothetical protein
VCTSGRPFGRNPSARLHHAMKPFGFMSKSHKTSLLPQFRCSKRKALHHAGLSHSAHGSIDRPARTIPSIARLTGECATRTDNGDDTCTMLTNDATVVLHDAHSETHKTSPSPRIRMLRISG